MNYNNSGVLKSFILNHCSKFLKLKELIQPPLYLCSSVINALINLSIKSKKPIGNGILTCDNKKQAVSRADPNKKNKGGFAVDAVISVFNIIK